MAVGLTWKAYAGVSVAAFSVAVANALASSYDLGQTEEETAKLMATALLSSKLSVLVLVNMAVCSLFLVGKLVQIVFFGRLRESETQHMYDRMLNYALFKIIFVSAILEPGVYQLVKWAAWFSILGFFKVFAQLSRDRFEYLMTSANTHITEHKRLVGLLLSIMVFDVAWFLYCLSSFHEPSYSVVFLLSFECFTLLLDTLQTLIKYGIHLARPDGNWENRGTYVYYTEFVTDSLILTATLCHYCHILYMHGFSFTLIDAVLFLNMRIVFNNLREKVAAYRNYRKLAHAMNVRFPSMTAEELDQLDDDCAICRERMTAAKRLPCKHVFHENCLRLWLEQHHSCPTCRCSLIDQESADGNAVVDGPQGPVGGAGGGAGGAGGAGGGAGGAGGAGVGGLVQEARAGQQPLFAAFLGQRRLEAGPGGAGQQQQGANWLHWLPGIGQQHVTPQMVEQVQGVLPHVPSHIARTDLERTGSVEVTIANILEGRVEVPEPAAAPAHGDGGARGTSPPRSPISAPSASVSNEPIPVTPKGFATTAEERSSRLAARKAALREQARRRLMEAQQRKAQAEADAKVAAEEAAATAAADVAAGASATVANGVSKEGQERGTTAHQNTSDAEKPREPAEAAVIPSAPPVQESGDPKRGNLTDSLEVRRRKMALAAERRMKVSSPALTHTEETGAL